MAAQPEAKRTVVTENHSEIRRRGRPPGSRTVRKTAQSVIPPEIEGFDYSRVKFTVNRMADFARYIDGYPNKAGLKMYLYRVKPKIDLGLIGMRDSNIRITTVVTEMTDDFIGRTHGRGMYTVKLNDVNREGITEICRCTFEADDPEFPPPIYDIRTLCLGEVGNQDEVHRQIQLGNLVRDGVTGMPRIRTQSDAVPAAAVPVAAAAPAPAAPAAAGGIVSNDLAAELIRGLLHRAGDNPGERVKETIEMARLMQAQPSAPAFDADTLVERVVQRLQGVQGKSLDDFAVYERVSGFIDKIRGVPAGEAAGAVAAAAESPAAWVASLPGILRELRAGIPEVINAVRGLRVEVGGRQVASVTQESAAALPRAQMTMKDRIAEVAQMAFEKMTAGMKGLDFAVYTCMYHPGGLEVYRFLMPGGTLGVLALCAMDDVTRGVVNDPAIRPQLEMWLDDFFTFDPDGGSADDGVVDHVASPAPNGSAATAAAGSSSSR